VAITLFFVFNKMYKFRFMIFKLNALYRWRSKANIPESGAQCGFAL